MYVGVYVCIYIYIQYTHTHIHTRIYTHVGVVLNPGFFTADQQFSGLGPSSEQAPRSMRKSERKGDQQCD